MAAGDYACAAAQVLNVDALVASDANPAGNYPGNAANANPWGEIRGRLGNLYMTLNTRLLGNPPNFAWPLASTDARPACGPPAVTLQATPASIPSGVSTTLGWSTQHATSCTAVATPGDPNWSNVSGTSGTYTTVALATSATYTLSCTGPGGTTQTPVTVTVVPPASITSFSPAAASVPVGGSTTLSWTVSPASTPCTINGTPATSPYSTGPLSVTTSFTLNCTNTVSTVTTQVTTVTVVPAPSIGSFSAAAASVPAGGSTTLSWTVTPTGTPCTVNGTAASSPYSTGPLSSTTNYTLSCSSVGGTATATATVTVVPAPKITSFKANPSNVDPDCVRDGLPASCSYTTLSWTATNAAACAISGGGLNRTGLPASGTLLSNKITAKTTFALGCSNAVNTTATATTTVTYLDLDDNSGD